MSYVWTPLAPSQSGVADYVETMIASDPDFEDVLFVTEEASEREGRNAVAPEGDVWTDKRALLQVGNSPHHGFVMERARMGGAVIDLHDLSLHQLHTELTLARNDFPSYLCGLRDAEGEWGRRLAFQRIKGFHAPNLEYHMRANKGLCDRARAIIVHSDWARLQLELQETETPVHVIPYPAITPEESHAVSRTREAARERLGLKPNSFTIVVAGRVTPDSRIDWVLDAFEVLRADGIDAELAIVGARDAANIDERVADSPHAGAIRMTGRVDDATFDEFIMAADILPVLRFPSTGGSSRVVARGLGFGRLVLAPEYAAFSDLPQDICEKIHLDRPIVDQMVNVFLTYADSPGRLSAMEMHAAGYARRHLGLERQREALKSVLDLYWDTP